MPEAILRSLIWLFFGWLAYKLALSAAPQYVLGHPVLIVWWIGVLLSGFADTPWIDKVIDSRIDSRISARVEARIDALFDARMSAQVDTRIDARIDTLFDALHDRIARRIAEAEQRGSSSQAPGNSGTNEIGAS